MRCCANCSAWAAPRRSRARPGGADRAAAIEAVIAAAWPAATPPTVDELNADVEYGPIAESWDPLDSEPFHAVIDSEATVGDHSFGSIDPPQDHW
jgi:hypothetical protein